MPGVYFCGAAALTAIFAISWFAFPRRRPGALLSASALAPFGFLGYVFVPGYWEPDHLVQFVPGVGIEDFLICFSEGGLAWMFAGYGMRRFEQDRIRDPGEGRLTQPFVIVRLLLRFALISGAGGTLSFGGALLGLEVMTAIVVGFTLIGVVVGARRTELLPGALIAGPGFAALHVGVGAVVLAFWPEAAEFWSVRILAGVRTFGLPVEEFAWALTFGACWPLFVQVAFFEVSRERSGSVSPKKKRVTASTHIASPLTETVQEALVGRCGPAKGRAASPARERSSDSLKRRIRLHGSCLRSETDG